MMITIENPKDAPAPAGPYSQVAKVETGNTTLLFISGQVPVDEAGNLVGDRDMEQQAHAVMRTLGALLRAYGADFGDIINIRSFLTDLEQRMAYGTVRNQYLSAPLPTSTTVEISQLFIPGALLEVEAVAAISAG